MEPITITSGKADQYASELSVQFGDHGVLETRRVAGQAPQLLDGSACSLFGSGDRGIRLRRRVEHQACGAIVRARGTDHHARRGEASG